MGPRSRLPAALRVLIALSALATVAGVVALMWSDRAPGFLVQLFGGRVHELWGRIDNRLSVNGRDAPPADFVLHALLWGLVTLLVAMVTWTYIGAIISGALVWVASILVEFGQRRYATTRGFEISDMIGNTIGVVAATLAALMLFALGSALASFFHALTGRARK